ncbi:MULTISPECIES: hypothetical protein [Streptomyces]|uniref:Uncharacterized protein n=1 Tax=Streptomyces violascens TaxID=67381 RepID=A0ABQ3QRG5_9ACTN|nr:MULTISPECIES: hypothetical protein [Streptomyces]EST17950.1 hypothetical protein M877_39780 [Streptomyces niveus NCIMB 11891]GHI39840.1 hypothetical protein Sviol_42480 [Streptomyces violascens]
MRTTMPESVLHLRIGAADSANGTIPTRLDLSAELGLDVDLVLGPIGGDEDELDELARLYALVDMADSGLIPRDATLDLIAGIVEEIEREDDLDGYEADDFAGGWAA